MHHQVLLITNSTPKSISISSFLLVTLFFSFIQVSYTQGDETLLQCFKPFECGNVTDLVFPFWNANSPPLCHEGGFELTRCDDGDDQSPIIIIGENEFRLLSFNSTGNTITIARNDLWEAICPSNLFNITLPEPSWSFSQTNQNLTFFYDCTLTSSSSPLPPSQAQFRCGQSASSSPSFYVDDSETDTYEHFRRSCGGGERIQVQVNRSGYEQLQREWTGNVGPRERWNLGFDVVYDLPKIFCDRCNSRDGLCDDLATPQYPICKRHGSKFFGLARVLVIAFAGALIIALIILVITVIVARRKIPCSYLWNFTKSDIDIEAFIRNNGIRAPKRYSYSDVKKITNSFKEKLGQGGYGTVYKGKLLDGNLVAVKVLNTKKGNGDEFINEVASISRTCHVNIVTLLGFCLDGPKRALIYDFMLNGSLDRFIYKKDTPKDRHEHLTSEELFKIAVGIARGLQYLHRGCCRNVFEASRRFGV